MKVNCSPVYRHDTERPMPDTRMLYKHNIMQYESGGWHCQILTHEVQTISWFFGDETRFKERKIVQSVSARECERMKKYRTCVYGELSQKGDAFSTDNKNNWEYPGPLWNCCRWFTYIATNCIMLPSKVYKTQQSDEMQATTADVSACLYHEGQCSLKNGDFLLWTVNKTEQCAVIPWRKIKGQRMGPNWISEDQELALSWNKARRFKSCDGTVLAMKGISREQGIPYTSEYGVRRDKREDNSWRDSIAMEDQLASELQTLSL